MLLREVFIGTSGVGVPSTGLAAAGAAATEVESLLAGTVGIHDTDLYATSDSRWHAIRCPSGDHAGSASTAASLGLVICFSPEPSVGIVKWAARLCSPSRNLRKTIDPDGMSPSVTAEPSGPDEEPPHPPSGSAGAATSGRAGGTSQTPRRRSARAIGHHRVRHRRCRSVRTARPKRHPVRRRFSQGRPVRKRGDRRVARLRGKATLAKPATRHSTNRDG